MLATALVAGIFAYGFNYYTLSTAERPFSPKHVFAEASGSVGVKMGMFGLAMFLVIFLTPCGNAGCWENKAVPALAGHHVLLGVAGRFVIALHAAFKFRGFAAMAFWIMVAVSVSGIVGRYLYGQIPRSLNAAELSLKEVRKFKSTGRATGDAKGSWESGPAGRAELAIGRTCAKRCRR